MTLNHSFLKRSILFLLLFQLAGFSPLFVPRAQALYWEDDTESNDPKEIKTRPSHFLLFDWIDDLNKDSKKEHYKELDNQDKGPSVNNDARTLVIVVSGIVGLGTGLFLANRFSTNSDTLTSDMFIGGALGLGAGILAGALIMPKDYDVAQRAQIDTMKYHQAWLQDPLKMQVAQAFHPMDVSLAFKF